MNKFKVRYCFEKNDVTPVEIEINAKDIRSAKVVASKRARDTHDANIIQLYYNNELLSYRCLPNSYWSDVYTYSDYDVARAEVEYRLKYDNPDNLTEDELYNQCYEDYYLFEQAWDDFVEQLSERLEKVAPTGYVHIDGCNMGWRGRSGELSLCLYRDDAGRYVETPANQARRLLQKITHSDSTIRMVVHGNKRIYFNVKHHDNPVNGDEYDVRGITANQFAA